METEDIWRRGTERYVTVTGNMNGISDRSSVDYVVC